jgi:hypothetical protein
LKFETDMAKILLQHHTAHKVDKCLEVSSGQSNDYGIVMGMSCKPSKCRRVVSIAETTARDDTTMIDEAVRMFSPPHIGSEQRMNVNVGGKVWANEVELLWKWGPEGYLGWEVCSFYLKTGIVYTLSGLGSIYGIVSIATEGFTTCIKNLPYISVIKPEQ